MAPLLSWCMRRPATLPSLAKRPSFCVAVLASTCAHAQIGWNPNLLAAPGSVDKAIAGAMATLVPTATPSSTQVAAPAPTPQLQNINPWNSERGEALVRVEVPSDTSSQPAVGTGFLVSGLGSRFFVMTATHVLLPKVGPDDVPPNACISVVAGTHLFQGNSGGPEVRPRCVYHLGSDISLIELYPRNVPPYVPLRVVARDLKQKDKVYFAGFPLGGDRDMNRSGQVTGTRGIDESIVTDILTAEGMSGGPYLDETGSVVGIHQGGVRYLAGYAQRLTIWQVRKKLEDLLPDSPSFSAEEDKVQVASRVIACRHPDNGIEGWGQTTSVQVDSGWRTGGSSPGEFCGAQILGRQRQYPSRQIILASSDELTKEEPIRRFFYRYTCVIQERWDPTYKLQENPKCRWSE